MFLKPFKAFYLANGKKFNQKHLIFLIVIQLIACFQEFKRPKLQMTRLKIKFVKLDISNWRIAKIECRQIGGQSRCIKLTNYFLLTTPILIYLLFRLAIFQLIQETENQIPQLGLVAFGLGCANALLNLLLICSTLFRQVHRGGEIVH